MTGETDSTTTGGTQAAPTSAPMDSSDAGGPEPVCTPGQVRCDGDDAQEVCSADGLAWEGAACPSGYACVPCEGDTCEGDLCTSPCDLALLEGPSSAGCSFLAARQLGLAEKLGPELGVPEEDWPPDGLLLLNPSDLPATVQLHDLEQGSTSPEPLGDPITLPPAAAEIFDLATPLLLGEFTTRRAGAMIWVESDVPIVAYSYSPTPPFLGNDSSMLLPETSLGRHYVVPSYPPHYLQHQGAGFPTYFDVLATAPGTTVRWFAQYAHTHGNGLPIDPVAAGQWSPEYSFGRFEGIRVIAQTMAGEHPHTADASGMVIEASKPIYVIGGSRCSAVPAVDTGAGCDPLTEALIPLEQWGQTYVVPHPPVRELEDHYYRIYGGDQGVSVSSLPSVIPGDTHTFASRGEYVDVVVPGGGSFVVQADGPVMVVGYLASRNGAGGLGDPAMYQHVPFEQADTRYALGAPAKWDEQYVQITREAGGAEVLLDGAAVTGWLPVSGYESTTVIVEPGVHILDSETPFVAIQFAYNNSGGNDCEAFEASECHSSYAHPVGMRTQQLYEP